MIKSQTLAECLSLAALTRALPRDRLSAMNAIARHPLMAAYLVAVILLAWWPWNFWLVFIAGFRRGRRSNKAFAPREAAKAAAPDAERLLRELAHMQRPAQRDRIG